MRSFPRASYMVAFALVGNKMVDLRRFENILPKPTEIATELASVTLPDGSKYEFITDVNMTMQTVDNKDAFMQVCSGPVPSNYYSQFNTAITAALNETDSTLFTNFDSVKVVVLDTEELVTENGYE